MTSSTTTTDAFTRINRLADFISDCEDQLQFTQLILQQLDAKQLLAIEDAVQEHISSDDC